MDVLIMAPLLGLDVAFSAILVTIAGFFTLVYVAIMRFKEGLRK